MNLKELPELIENGIGMVVATRDAQLFPDVGEGSGLVLSEDFQSCSVFVSSQRSKASLANIQDNGCIAISLSNPCTYKAAQIKGRAFKVRPMSEKEKMASAQWLAAYRREIQLVGMMNVAAESILREPDTAVDVHIENIYIQTPGSRAGQLMGPE